LLKANDRQEGWGQRKSSKRDEIDLERQRNGLTVGTTVVPNLANRGNVVGKSIPFSQTLAPPVVDPDSGFTSVRAGVDSMSVPGGGIARPRGSMSLSDLGVERALE